MSCLHDGGGASLDRTVRRHIPERQILGEDPLILGRHEETREALPGPRPDLRSRLHARGLRHGPPRRPDHGGLHVLEVPHRVHGGGEDTRIRAPPGSPFGGEERGASEESSRASAHSAGRHRCQAPDRQRRHLHWRFIRGDV